AVGLLELGYRPLGIGGDHGGGVCGGGVSDEAGVVGRDGEFEGSRGAGRVGRAGNEEVGDGEARRSLGCAPFVVGARLAGQGALYRLGGVLEAAGEEVGAGCCGLGEPVHGRGHARVGGQGSLGELDGGGDVELGVGDDGASGEQLVTVGSGVV